MIGFFIALLSGALMSVQGVFNTKVTENSSMWAANVFVQFTAFIVCFVAWLFADRTSFREVLAVEPKYFLLGGVIGAFITLTVIKSMDSLGPAKAVMLREQTSITARARVSNRLQSFIIIVLSFVSVDSTGGVE